VQRSATVSFWAAFINFSELVPVLLWEVLVGAFSHGGTSAANSDSEEMVDVMPFCENQWDARLHNHPWLVRWLTRLAISIERELINLSFCRPGPEYWSGSVIVNSNGNKLSISANVYFLELTTSRTGHLENEPRLGGMLTKWISDGIFWTVTPTLRYPLNLGSSEQKSCQEKKACNCRIEKTVFGWCDCWRGFIRKLQSISRSVLFT